MTAPGDPLSWARVVPPEAKLAYAALAERERVIDEVLRAVSDAPGSAAIVGAAGVGKGVVAREAARRLAAENWTVIEASAGEAIAGLKYVGEIEERLQMVLDPAGRSLWLLPDIGAALTAGAWAEDPYGLLDRMIPLLEQGQLRLLAPCEPAVWTAVAQARPALAGLMAAIRLAPAGEEETLELAGMRLAELGTGMDPAELREGLELAREQLPTIASPGDLLRLLHTAVRRMTLHAPPPRLTRADLIPALAELTGLPEDILDERRALDLAEVERFLSERVLGQPAAVDVLVERVALIKAGLTDPTRPLGVFLFTGPTGTGKTELAKALASYLFGSPQRLIRVDMSELQTAADLDRLIGEPGTGGGDALTAAIRREPFSVVLLDEVEKAHPLAYDLFLQVFDDGRLSDRAGATADFRHAVVIMTANITPVPAHAPAAVIGFAPAEPVPAAAPALEPALDAYFRPEFLNRIDRVVTFTPLSREVMRALVAKELRDVTLRRGLRTRPWAVEWDDSAIDVLLREGFTVTLGARPLKRAVEEHVLAPLARAIVEHRVPGGDRFLFVRSADGRHIDVHFVDPDLDVAEASRGAPLAERDVRAIALDPDGSDAEVVALRDALERLTARVEAPGWRERKAAALEALSAEGFWDAPERFRVLGDAEQRDRIEAALATARSLLSRLVRARAGRGRPGRLARLLAQRLMLLDLALDALEAGEPPDAFLLVQPVDPAGAGFAKELAAMYRTWAERRGMRLEELGPWHGPGKSGVLLGVSGLGALRVLAPEAGLHVFERPARHRAFERAAVRVTVAPQPVQPAPGDRPGRRRLALAALRQVPASPAVARRYRREPSGLVRDSARGWRTGRVDRVLEGDFDLMADEG